MAEPASRADLCGHLHGCSVPEDVDRRPCAIEEGSAALVDFAEKWDKRFSG